MSEEHEQVKYVATRVVQPGRRPNDEYWAQEVTFQKRADGRLDVEHSGKRITAEGDEVQRWLARAGLDNNLQPLDKN